MLSLGIVAIIRDWSRRDAANKETYPESPIKEIPIKLWTFEEQEQFITDRITKHSYCDFAMETDIPLPDCTPSEMWEKPTTWAIKKKGGVKAKKVYDREDYAVEALKELSDEYEIEVRLGERTRCANFCQVREFCQQWKDYQDANNS